jgi:hypothetical protein
MHFNQILPAENERAMTAQILDRAAEENSRNQTGNRTQHKPADTEETGNPEEDEWTCPASFDTPEIRAEARRVYESGRFLEYCRDTFSKVWYGDFHILEAILYQSADARMGNPEDGIHLHSSGVKGMQFHPTPKGGGYLAPFTPLLCVNTVLMRRFLLILSATHQSYDVKRLPYAIQYATSPVFCH